MDKLNRGKRAYSVFLVCATMAIALQAQTFITLQSFDYTDGKYPDAGLVQATDGNLYGTTYGGGARGFGVVFKITPSGMLTVVYSFCSKTGCKDGAGPNAALVQATDGNFYGTTTYGGANDGGEVFKITPSGMQTVVYNFCSKTSCADGRNPYAALVQATDGSFYGTTVSGGAKSVCVGGCGTVFKITPSGTLTTLHNFDSTDGKNPYAGLVQATDGNFYGTTFYGGAHREGEVFKITPSGMLTVLYSFCSIRYCPDGFNPYAGLVQATDGNFYGTTLYGGNNDVCGSYRCGTVFKITPSGMRTTLYNFCSKSGCTDGHGPYAGLVQGTDGSFYGTTVVGGTGSACQFGCGVVFKVAPSGTLTTLHSFDKTDGFNPYAGLAQDTNGKFYGTAYGGGDFNDGTVFSLSVGLGPFVETQPTSGKVGAAVKILGTNLTGATSVTFNGTSAVFKVVSSSEITTSVPAGATTGKVKVVTPHGMLSSNVPFRVLP
jgi:uncharacterized repeat protein (TIGR03803 family)